MGRRRTGTAWEKSPGVWIAAITLADGTRLTQRMKPRPHVVAPSWAATERVLWLAALDRCLRATEGDTARVLIALRSMRAAIGRDGPRAYGECVLDDERELRWLHALRDHLRPHGVQGLAVLVWCAVLVWTDAARAPWSRLADAAERVARAMPESATGRAAEELRAVMAGTWAMEGGR